MALTPSPSPSPPSPARGQVGASGKMRVLDRLLLKLHAKGHRVVLFSQFSSMVDLLDDYCTMRGFNFVRLTGSTNRVQRMVNLQAFNAPGSKVGLSLEPEPWPSP